MGSEARARLGLLALLAVTLFSFEQLFAGADYVGPALLGIGFGSAVAIVARRFGVPTLVVLAVSALALTAYVSLIFGSHHTFYGLPTPRSLAAVADDVVRAFGWSRIDYAPVRERPGYVILTIAGMWAAATIGELATFRWRRPIVATLIPVGLFSFLLIVGTGTVAQAYVVAFLAALLAYWALESAHRVRSWGRWVHAWSRRGPQDEAPLAARLARRMGASCIAAALVSPLLLPRIEQGLLSWRSSLGDGSGIGAASSAGPIDLLVTLKPNLVNQSDIEMFRVRAPRAAYWRLASLGEFDGETWQPVSTSSLIEDVQEDTSLPELGGHRIEFPAQRGAERLRQEVFIANLQSDQLPAAVQPASVAVEEWEGRTQQDVEIHPETGEIRIEDGAIKDLNYRVESVVPRATRDALRTAALGETDNEEYLDAGDAVSLRVEALARRITRGERGAFDRLVALQDYLRGFSYSTDIEQDAAQASSAEYLETFLFETKRGYCQQFATAFALLARSLDIPTRVSVGFLPGTSLEPGQYSVRGTDAHAWPEVLFDGLGWVRFEPTPRSLSAPPSYTLPAVNPVGAAGAASDRPSSNLRANDVRVNQNVDTGGLQGTEPRLGQDRRRTETANAWQETFSGLALALLLGALAALVATPGLKAWHVRRRYFGARAPVELARAAFEQFEYEGGQLARRRSPAESPSRYAQGLARLQRVPGAPAARLAWIYERAEYSPSGVSPQQASEARRLARDLRSRLWARASWWERAARLFSPRGLRG